MDNFPQEVTKIIESYVFQTESEEQFKKRWIRMDMKEKDEMRKKYEFEYAPYKEIRKYYFELPSDMPIYEVYEALLHYTFLNEVPDYDEDTCFRIYERDEYLVARSFDTASVLLQIYTELLGRDEYHVLVDLVKNFLQKDVRDIQDLVTMISEVYLPEELMSEPFSTYDIPRDKLITKDSVLEMIRKKSPTE